MNINTKSRPSWEEYFSDLTVLTASRSSCHRLKVGCILVNDNRIIAQGYNGYLPGAPHEQLIKDGHEIATVHAEQNAIADCAKRGVSCNNSTAYITHYPCVNCIKMLCAAGVNDVKYIDNYNNDSVVETLAKSVNVNITQIQTDKYCKVKVNA
jgi:dCMP deaminase